MYYFAIKTALCTFMQQETCTSPTMVVIANEKWYHGKLLYDDIKNTTKTHIQEINTSGMLCRAIAKAKLTPTRRPYKKLMEQKEFQI